MQKLTPRQAEILQLIQTRIEQAGLPPTRKEIALTLGFRSPNAAEEHLRALARKGVIEMIPGTSRGIRLVTPTPAAGLPVIGQVAAGSPILAQEHIEKSCDIAPDFFSPRADYLLRVQGMSMKDAGILDGDLLAVHKTTEARNGQIVIARLDDDVTVKRYYRSGHKVELQPENEAFRTLEVDLRRQPMTIEGLGIGVIRESL